MIQFSYDELLAWFNSFFWPFFRLLGLFLTAPLFSESGIPARVKIGLAAITAFTISPFIDISQLVEPNNSTLLLLIMMQTLIGILMGLTMRVVFAAIQTAGEFIGLQMGLSFASFFEPATGANTAVLARTLKA